MESLKDLRKFGDSLPGKQGTMPVLFVGHGNPMNAIEDNEFSRGWRTVITNVGVRTEIDEFMVCFGVA